MSLNKRFWGLKYQNGNKKEFIPESIRIKKADVQKVSNRKEMSYPCILFL